MHKNFSAFLFFFLSLNLPSIVYPSSCASNPITCSADDLCFYATEKSSTGYRWTTNRPFKKFVLEAYRRGLKCKTGHSAKKNSANETYLNVDYLRVGFLALDKKLRFLIQRNLKKLGFYTSNIDGLWGKNTRTAIINFSKKK